MRTPGIALIAALSLVTLSIATASISVAKNSSQVGPQKPLQAEGTVLFADDFSSDPLGASPRYWSTKSGSFAVAARGDEQWLSLIGSNGEVEMDVPGALPQRWTLEFDLLQEYAGDTGIALLGIDAKGNESWSLTLGQYGGTTSTLDAFESHSSAVLAKGASFRGQHHVTLTVNGNEVAARIDQQSLNVKSPVKVDAAGSLRFRLTEPSALVTNVRLTGIDAASGQAERLR